MKKVSLLLSALVAALFSWGQSTTIHFDKPYYFSGENIFYSFCNMDLPSGEASARIELQNSHEVVDYYYTTIDDRCGQGFIKLPHELATGIYSFSISVFSQKNFEKNTLALVALTIYNDQDIETLESGVEEIIPINLSLSPAIKTSAEPLAVRESINLSIDIPDDLKSSVKRISVVVRDHHLYANQVKTVFHTSPSGVSQHLIRGVPFSGVRKLINPGSIKSNLLFSFNAGDMVYDGAPVDLTTNEFNLELTPFYQKRQISFLDYLDNEIQITERTEDSERIHPTPLKIDSDIIKHLNVYREEKQINRIFKQLGIELKPDSLLLIRNRKKPDFLVDVQDYNIRGTSVQLFKELSTDLKFRSIGGGDYRARMIYEYNGITKFYSRAPLFLVNGRATRNGPLVAGFPLQEIRYFRIYSDYEALEDLSPMAHGGIVYVDMMDPNYSLPDDKALPDILIQGMQVPLQYPVCPDIKEGAPSVGSLLYWNPSIDPDGSVVQIECVLNDIATHLLVEVVLHLSKTGETEVMHQVVEVHPGQ